MPNHTKFFEYRKPGRYLGRIKFDPVKIRLFKNDEFDNGNDSEGSNVEDGNNLLSYE